MSCWHLGGHWFWGFSILRLFFLVMMVFLCVRWIRIGRRWRTAEESRADRRSSCCWGYGRGWKDGSRQDSPEEILDRRYASGEITEEQYRRMKEEIN